jgi:hypothetical protein
MMRMRGDMRCFHEPFGEPWYHGEKPLWPRLTPESPRTPGLTFESVWKKLESASRQGPVFSKDFPHYIKHMWDDELLDNFKHSFLIRDPAKVVTSMYKHWPDFVLEELAFVEQRKLFDRLTDQLGRLPPVIDSDDLLEDPCGIVEIYCKAVDIPFIPEALKWEAGDRREVSWYDGGSWHGNLRNSTGLAAQPRQYIDIDAAPVRVRKIYDICLPHYEHLYQYRLAVE